MINVVHYVAAFSPLSQTFVYDLITGLENRKLTLNTVLTRRRELPQERPFKRTYVCKNRNPIKKLLARFTDPSHLKIHNKKIILSQFKNAKVDIIHSHFAISALRMNELLNSQKLRIPHICSFHGNDVLTNPHKIPGYKEALLRLNNYPQVLITVPSQFLKDVCVELGLRAEKIQVVHNTIHPRFFSSPEAVPWNGTEQLKIITVGRLVEMKGHEFAIRAMSKLKDHFSNFQYFIAGSGVLEKELKALVQDLRLEKHVIFLGNISHENVPQILSESHICLIPSVRAHDGEEDTFCLSLVEGSILGLYCLSSDTRGPVEVLGPNKEFIYPQKNSDAIYQALINAISNPETMAIKSKKLKEYMAENYHPENYFTNYYSIYKSLYQENLL